MTSMRATSRRHLLSLGWQIGKNDLTGDRHGQRNRPGLLLQHGIIYIGFATFSYACANPDCCEPLAGIFVLPPPNGSGTSTTMNMITGLISPTHGNILFNDHREARAGYFVNIAKMSYTKGAGRPKSNNELETVNLVAQDVRQRPNSPPSPHNKGHLSAVNVRSPVERCTFVPVKVDELRVGSVQFSLSL